MPADNFMKTHTNQTGFTLIELLISIAIIGILASIVLSSLNTARDKAADVTIKSNLAGMRAQAQLYYEEHTGTYDVSSTPVHNVCLDTDGVYNLLSAASITVAATAVITNGNQSDTTANCNVTGDAWIVQVPLKQQNQVNDSSGVDFYCVDSQGSSKIEDAPLVNFDSMNGTPSTCL